ncbi:MAG TPA: helix-turn-helix domain-containing protein [Ktedonobacteraceae bacterium]|nr:helix-turn-helix domain-containing protein [Ktedonobacteraceae bacterium]
MRKNEETTVPLPTNMVLLTIPQAMTILGIGRTRIYELIKREHLPVVKIGPGAVRIKLDSLQEWIQARERREDP